MGKVLGKQLRFLLCRRAKHTFERPYICDVCGEGFTRSDKLVVHRVRKSRGSRIFSIYQIEIFFPSPPAPRPHWREALHVRPVRLARR